MWYIILICITAVVCWGLGLLVGVASERKSWLVRAATQDNKWTIAKHCDGKFYYVIEEGYFANNFSMREKSLQEQKDEWCENELKGWLDK